MFYTNYERFCRMIGEAPNTVAVKCGVTSTGTVTGWRSGAVPRPRIVDNIVKYFRSKGIKCEVADLFAEEEEDNSLEVRQRLRESAELKILFDAAENAPPSALLEAAALIMRYKEGKN